MKSDIAKSGKNSELLITLLHTLLADEYVLYTKTRNAHWYIEQLSFLDLPRLLEKQVVALDIIIDDIAEIMQEVRYKAPVTMRNFLKTTRLSEWNEDSFNNNQMIITLLEDHETIIQLSKKDILLLEDHNAGSRKLITEIIMKHEQIAEVLRTSPSTKLY